MVKVPNTCMREKKDCMKPISEGAAPNFKARNGIKGWTIILPIQSSQTVSISVCSSIVFILPENACCTQNKPKETLNVNGSEFETWPF
mmetsp:Transcript_13166/g.23291  ORF Transcript_13166/g.23291 Transcript_13166/m.23291 type:complete len:88 (+) Transcript_13166:794-1057(+)